jgi:hypothetical protein
MQKIKVPHFDLPIIRSCNLACVGCMTYSNHKNIKGIVRVDESREWLKFWADRIDPPSITLFGGEPLLHPEFTEWVQAVSEAWGADVPINFNTNGYYLETLYDRIPELFGPGVELSMVVSYQTGTEPYLSKVKNDFETLKQRIVDYYLTLPGIRSANWNLWLDELEINTKQWYRLLVNGQATRIGFATCEQYKLHWTKFYDGYAETMKPVYNYDDNYWESNYHRCQTNNFTTLYRGRMYKCPPVGVLEHTLTTFNLTEDPDWRPYLDNYKSVGPENTDEEIQAWFEQTYKPEYICNMCGFSGPKGGGFTGEQRSHILKNYWKYTL